MMMGKLGIAARRPAVVPLVVVAAVVAGCGGGESQGPVLAGGREVKAWVKDLHDPNPRVRRQAVMKLGNVGDADSSVADGLIEALGDPDVLVRRDAILAAAKLRTPPPALREKLDAMSRTDKDPRAREVAGKAVVRLGGGG
ncbi:MAG: HEAT repeat domain-containing protein [Isosphaeraceae bacterium]